MYQNYEKTKTISYLNILSEIGGIFTIMMLVLGVVKTLTLLLSRAVEGKPSLQWLVCCCSTHTERASKFYKHLDDAGTGKDARHHRLEDSLIWLDSMIHVVENAEKMDGNHKRQSSRSLNAMQSFALGLKNNGSPNDMKK